MNIMKTVTVEKRKYASANFAEIKSQLENEGYSVFSWQDSPGAYYSPHSHDHDEYIVVVEGTIVFEIDRQRYRLDGGDALVLPANTIHAAANEGKSTVRYFICS